MVCLGKNKAAFTYIICFIFKVFFCSLRVTWYVWVRTKQHLLISFVLYLKYFFCSLRVTWYVWVRTKQHLLISFVLKVFYQGFL